MSSSPPHPQHDFGIYVHVPYCEVICPFCDFNVHVDRDPPWDALAAAIVRELDFRLAELKKIVDGPLRCRSLYFGGGTPSLAPAFFVQTIVEAVDARISWKENAERTLEANPGGEQTTEYLGDLRQLGINRLSLGWQSTHDILLKTLGRHHTAAQSQALFQAARAAKFDNLSVDLIYAVPQQSEAMLEADLSALVQLAPEHISLYALTYHEGTLFDRWRRKGKILPIAEPQEATMYQQIEARLSGAGFDHYEVSAYARTPKHQSQHNTLYWQGRPYLGLGPGAHGFLRPNHWQQGWRWENVRKPKAYLAAWQHAVPTGEHESWRETLDHEALILERVMCGLRTQAGLHLDEAPLTTVRETILVNAMAATKAGLCEFDNHTLRPTASGMQRADALAQALLRNVRDAR